MWKEEKEEEEEEDKEDEEEDEEENDCKSHRNREIDIKLCLPENIRWYTHNVSPTYVPIHDLSKHNTNRHANMYMGIPGGSALKNEEQATKEC